MTNAVSVNGLIEGLSQPQRARLLSYQTRLSKNRDYKLFDGKMRHLLLDYSVDPHLVRSTISYLDNLGYAQSVYHYDQIEEQIEKFQEPNHPYFGWNRNYLRAKEDMKLKFSRLHLSSLQYTKSNIIDALPKKDTSSGFEGILTGKMHKGDFADELYGYYAETESRALKSGSFNLPLLIASRTQASGGYDINGKPTNDYASKSRLVSMVSLSQILAETKFAKPLQQRLALSPWYAGGKSSREIMALILKRRERYNYWTTIDYSKYDMHISDWLIDDAFDIIRCAFLPGAVDEDLLTIVRSDFKNKVFIDGEGHLRQSHKGVPSGSMFTQIIDSIINLLVITTYFFAKDLGTFDALIMGDDNLIYSFSKIDLSDLQSYLSKNFGLVMNASKSTQGSAPKGNPEFLSRFWTPYGVWRAPTVMLEKLLYPERFRYYDDYTPEEVLFSYYLEFPLGFRELISYQFLEDNPLSSKVIVRSRSFGKKSVFAWMDRYTY